jgi:hypothetical protein
MPANAPVLMAAIWPVVSAAVCSVLKLAICAELKPDKSLVSDTLTPDPLEVQPKLEDNDDES